MGHSRSQSGQKRPRSDLFPGVKNSDGEFQQVILCPEYAAGCNYSVFRKKENWMQFCSHKVFDPSATEQESELLDVAFQKKIMGRNYTRACLHSDQICLRACAISK